MIQSFRSIDRCNLRDGRPDCGGLFRRHVLSPPENLRTRGNLATSNTNRRRWSSSSIRRPGGLEPLLHFRCRGRPLRCSRRTDTFSMNTAHVRPVSPVPPLPLSAPIFSYVDDDADYADNNAPEIREIRDISEVEGASPPRVFPSLLSWATQMGVTGEILLGATIMSVALAGALVHVSGRWEARLDGLEKMVGETVVAAGTKWLTSKTKSNPNE